MGIKHVAKRWVPAISTAVWLLGAAACGPSERSEDTDAVLGSDSGAPTTPSVAKDCESPLNPLSVSGPSQQPGCSCAGWSTPDYCIREYGATCSLERDGRWWFGKDGRCFPFKSQDELEETCRARRGVLVDSIQRCSASGFASLRPSFDARAADGGVAQACCHPIDVTAELCAEAGLHVLEADPQTSLLDTRCSNGGELRGFVTDRAGGPHPCCTSP